MTMTIHYWKHYLHKSHINISLPFKSWLLKSCQFLSTAVDIENETTAEWQENIRVEWVLCSAEFEDMVQISPKELNNIQLSQIMNHIL